MKQIISIQILRGIAAWFVVFHHYIQLLHLEHNSGLAYFFAKKGAFGVNIFFIISGFIMYITLTKKNYLAKDFIVHRILRILPAYWFYTFLTVLFCYYFPQEILNTSYNIKSLFLSLLFLPSLNPSGIGVFPLLTVGWTLNFELFFYLMLTICILFFKKNIFITCSIIMLALPLIKFSTIPLLWRYTHILNNFIIYEFIFGIMIAFLYKKKIFNYNIFYTLIIAIIAMFLLMLGDKKSMYWSLSAALLIISALSIEKNLLSLNFKFLHLLGDTSYSTYLVHILLIGLFKYYFSVKEPFLEFIFLLALSMSIFFLSWLSYIIVEKYPVILYKKLIRKNYK